MSNTNAAQKSREISESTIDPKQAHLEALGVFSDTIFHSQVLVMTYIRPTRTQGGIILTAKTQEEDRFQGKIGLVVAKGAGAFKDAGEFANFHGDDIQVGDWVLVRPSDGAELFYNGCSLRLFEDVNIRARVSDPMKYW